jgi:Pectate lyase superfamily protein/Right handed beta helix region
MQIPRIVGAGALLCLSGPDSISSLQAAAPPAGLVVSVKDYGAVGDGKTADTDAIQRAVNAVAPGGTVRFPPGKYKIETNKGVTLKDNIRLDLQSATLVGPNVAGARCRIFTILGKRNITISGGTLIGSTAGTPEWGVGILAGDAQDLVIENVWFRDFYYEGILLTGNAGCHRVAVRHCVSVNNRRTGIAVVHASDVTVEDSTFNGTVGQSPQAGLNAEPNSGESVRKLRIRRCWFRGNKGGGLYIHKALGEAIADVSVENSVFEDNDYGIVVSDASSVYLAGNRIFRHTAHNRAGIALGAVRQAKVHANRLEGNFRGVLSSASSGVDIRGNLIVGAGASTEQHGGEGRDGVLCLGGNAVLANACIVANNTIRRPPGSGIVTRLVTGTQLLNNIIENPGQRAIHMRGTSTSQARGNQISGAAGEPPPGRYDAIELEQLSNNNLVVGNTIRRSPGLRNVIGVAGGCVGNQVAPNTVLN